MVGPCDHFWGVGISEKGFGRPSVFILTLFGVKEKFVVGFKTGEWTWAFVQGEYKIEKNRSNPKIGHYSVKRGRKLMFLTIFVWGLALGVLQSWRA